MQSCYKGGDFAEMCTFLSGDFASQMGGLQDDVLSCKIPTLFDT